MMAHKTSPQFNAAIVGAGFGGLAIAIALKTKWGFDDFVIYERGPDIGGTWRDNTYPGCAPDVHAHLYSLSTDLQTDWKHTHATQPEILEYMRRVADKYGLRKHCRFHTSLDKAEWDADANVWRIETCDVRTGEKQLTRATALVSAMGALVVPKFPKLEGIDSFKGEVFHSAQWRHDVDLRGKCVGVLGNGSSASQFIPVISKDPTVTVVNFARTRMWYLPSYEKIFLVFKAKGNNYVSKFMTKGSREYITKTAPVRYHHLIIPTYPFGCKRIVRDQGYLQSLSRPNVRLTFDRITHVEPDGVITETNEMVDLDVIIYGTGFSIDNHVLNVHGTRGTLKEYYDAQGGPTAYLGTTVPGFPNFFMMLGPNTNTGHTSALFSQESQIPLILQLLAPVRSGALTSVVPTDAATDKYNDMLQERLENSVWSQCASWYRAGARGRIFGTFPGPVVLLWWWLRKPRWDDYEVKGPDAEQWRRRHDGSRVYKALAMTFTLVVALGGLAFVAYREEIGLSGLAGQAAYKWSTILD